MGILEILTYAGALTCVLGLGAKTLKYAKMPVHVRWELYPIPHEGRPWGGSSFEDVDQWAKPRHKDHAEQVKFMVPEILFIRALYENNRPLWLWSFPFHMGLYLCIGALALFTVSALLEMAGYAPGNSGFAYFVLTISRVLAICGYVMGLIGALGLIFKRSGDRELSQSSAGIDYLNLVWLGAIFATGLIVWLADPGFAVSKKFLIGLISFKGSEVPPGAVQTANLLLFIGFIAYFPFTHMSHMIMKYFMWDKVKWDDAPNRANPQMDAKIQEYLSYKVGWSAPHVESEGKKSWGEVATSNPWAKDAR